MRGLTGLTGLTGLAAAIAATLVAGVVAAIAHSHSSIHAIAIPAARRLGPAPKVTSASEAKRQAMHDAEQLLSLVRLPPGAHRVDGPPAGLEGGPVMGIPSGSTIVDKASYWLAPGSFDSALAWLAAHPPSGLTQSGSANGGGPGVRTGGFAYTASSGPLLRAGQLEIGAASTSKDDTTGLRVDAVTSWLDPKPIRDNQPGRRVRVTVANGCPATIVGAIGVTNPPDDDLSVRIVPNELPVSGLVCEYNGLNETPPSGLSSQRSLDATAATRIAREFFGLDPAHIDGAEFGCPNDDGTHAIYVFGYPDRPDVDVWVNRSGCRAAANGHIVVSGTVT